MKTPIRIRYILLVLLSIAGVFLWFRLPYYQPVSVLRQAINEDDFANTFTGSYLAGYIASKNGDWQQAAELFEESRKLAPKNVALLENTYIFKLLMGEVKPAMILARKHQAGDIASSVSVVLRATDAMQSRQYHEAGRLVKMIMPGNTGQMSVGSVIAPFLTAWINVAEGKPEAAITLLRSLQGKGTINAIASYHLALVYDHQGRQKEAEAAYKGALSGEVKPYHFVLAAGNFYLREKNPEAAKALFEAYVEANPYSELFSKELTAIQQGKTHSTNERPDIIKGWVEVLMEGVRIASQSKLNDEGTAYLQLVNYLAPEFPQSLMLLADHYEEKEEYAKANTYYARIPPESSFYWESRINTARNEYKNGNKKVAEKSLRALAAERPDNYAAPLELAELLREDDKYADAAAAYAQVVERIEKPLTQHWYIFYAQGVCYEQSKQWEQAEAAFLKALDLNPDQPDVLNYLGYSWLVQGKNLSRAKAMIETAVSARPDDAHIMDSMGWVLFKAGNYEKSAYYLEQAIEAMPYDPTVNDHLGDLYWRMGRFKEAQYQWERVLNASSPDPEPELVEEIRKKLKNGLSTEPAASGSGIAENRQLSNNRP